MIDQNWEPKFIERLKVHYDEMKWLYSELYNNDQQAFDYFVTMLHNYYADRGMTQERLCRTGTREMICLA